MKKVLVYRNDNKPLSKKISGVGRDVNNRRFTFINEAAAFIGKVREANPELVLSGGLVLDAPEEMSTAYNRQFDFSNVKSVYSGKDGACCCGCAGKHTYASKYREAAGKERGYAIRDEEINDRVVKTIYNKVMLWPADHTEYWVDGKLHFVSITVGKRLYTVYFLRG